MPQTPPTPGASWRQRLTRLHPAWCGLLGFLLYLPTLGFGFVNHDDFWLIRDNSVLRQPGLGSLRTIWLDLSWAARRALGSEFLPVRDSSVMLDYLLFGDWIGGHHLSQVLLYGLVCAGLGWALERWTRRRELAWLGAALFALHPVHVEAVAWLSERKGLLAALFMLAAAVMLESWRRLGGWWRWALVALALVLAIWSKGMAVASIGALAALVWLFPAPGEGRLPGGRTLLGLLGLALCSALAFYPVWYAGSLMEMVQGYHGGGLGATAWMMLEVHGFYVRQMFLVGGGYGIVYPFSAAQVEPASAISGVILLVAALVLGLWGAWARTRGPARHLSLAPEALGASWWLIWLAPVSQILFPLQNIAADRYLFLPAAGWAVLVAALLLRLREGRPRVALVAALCAVLSLLSLLQTRTWSSTEALFAQSVEVNPGYAGGWSRLAQTAAQAGDLEAAGRYVALGLEHSPGDADLLHRQALLLRQAGRPQEALAMMRRAAQAARGPHRAQANLSLMLSGLGQHEEAVTWGEASVQGRGAMVPHHQRAYGGALLGAGRPQEALAPLRRAVELEPGKAQNHYNLGLALWGVGQGEAARAALKEAVALDPAFGPQVEALLRQGAP